MNGEQKLVSCITGKRVVFIATKNKDYIRIHQETDLLKKYAAECKVIAYDDKSYLLRIVKVFATLFRTSLKNYDVVFIGFMAQMIVPFFHHKFKNRVVITDFFISMYDTLVDDRKKFSAKSLVVADTMAHAKYFLEEFKANESKFVILYLKANEEIYFPHEVLPPKELQGKFIVLYFGSILPVQGVDVVLECIREMENDPRIHFLVIGPINNKIPRPKTSNVTYIDWLPQEKLSDCIAYADLCLGGHFSNTVGKAQRTIPGKVFIYKALRKKVILGDSSANRELFDAGEDSIYVERGNPEALAEAIKKECYRKAS